MKEILRLDEVAEELKVSVSTIRRMIANMDNPLKCTRVGNQKRVRRVDLDEYLRRNEVVPYE